MARAEITMPRRAAAAWLAPGESGALSVITGLIVIGIIFQSLNGHFLSPVNLTDLLVQGAVFMLLGMSEVFALLLGDIDLSIGFVSGIGGVITAELLIGSRDWPWWAAVIAALLVTTAIGALQGTLIARLRLPSFVVTLAGLLACNGLVIWILGSGGTLPISDNVINDLANGCLTPTASWLVMAAIVAAFAVVTIRRDADRRSAGAGAGNRGVGQPDRRQGRRRGRGRAGHRRRVQHQPRRAQPGPRRAVGGADRPGRPVQLVLPAQPDPVRPGRARDRQQCRSGPAGRGQLGPDPHRVLRPGRPDRRGGRHRLRLRAAVGLVRHGRRDARAVRRRRPGARRHQPVRPPGHPPGRTPRRPRHRAIYNGIYQPG
jgi:hypothetical protein